MYSPTFGDQGEFFARERAAFRVVGERIRHLLAAGYEIRSFDNVPSLAHELYFIGAGEPGKRIESEKLRLPYEYISMLIANDHEASMELRRRLADVNNANKAFHDFVMEQVAKKFTEAREDDHSGR